MPGPVITATIEPATCVKACSVNLAKDLARLSLVSIRVIETIPAKTSWRWNRPTPSVRPSG